MLQWKLSSFEIQSLPLDLQGILAGGKRKLTEAFNGRQQDSSVLQMLSLWIHTCVLGIMLSFARDGGHFWSHLQHQHMLWLHMLGDKSSCALYGDFWGQMA